MNVTNLVRRVTDFTLANHDERDCWMKAPVISAVLLSRAGADVADHCDCMTSRRLS
jgi:hypothetical protein